MTNVREVKMYDVMREEVLVIVARTRQSEIVAN
jgi:hypothetical protein